MKTAIVQFCSASIVFCERIPQLEMAGFNSWRVCSKVFVDDLTIRLVRLNASVRVASARSSYWLLRQRAICLLPFWKQMNVQFWQNPTSPLVVIKKTLASPTLKLLLIQYKSHMQSSSQRDSLVLFWMVLITPQLDKKSWWLFISSLMMFTPFWESIKIDQNRLIQ
jgi:hypothetical protein